MYSKKKNEDESEKLAADWTRNLMPEEAEAILQKAGTPSCVVARPKDVYEDIQHKDQRHFIAIDHPVMGRQSYETRTSFILLKSPRRINRRSPCLGEHSEFVFKNLMGMTDEEPVEYISDKSIATELSWTIQGQYVVT